MTGKPLAPEDIAVILARAERIRGVFPALGRGASVELVICLQIAAPEVVAEVLKSLHKPIDGKAISFQDFYVLCRHCFPVHDENYYDVYEAAMKAAGWR